MVIKASAIRKGHDPQYSAEVVRKMQPPSIPPAKDVAFTEYEITGGDPQERTAARDASGNFVYQFGYVDPANRFISYKVLPGVALDGRSSVAATDYLKHNDNVTNLGFNVAGVSNDTYRVGSSAKRPLTFFRSADKDATAVIDLFYPKDATHDGLQPIGKMIFVYGYVDEIGGKRWGWIPLSALKPKRCHGPRLSGCGLLRKCFGVCPGVIHCGRGWG